MKEIAPNIYVSTEYAGVNVGFIVVPGGAIAVDAPALPHDARAWRKRITETAGGPILYVVLTDGHPDRVLSAGLMGGRAVGARMAYDRVSAYTDGFWRGVIDGWSHRYPDAADDLAAVSPMAPQILVMDRLTLCKGGADITVECVAGAAPGSVWIHLPEQDVLFAGDTLVVGVHPVLEQVPDSKAWLNTLKSLRRERYAHTIIVPGRGPVSDQSATNPLSEYIALVRRRARSLRSTKRTREDRMAMVSELQAFFPTPQARGDAIQRRVRVGLDRVCEELQGD